MLKRVIIVRLIAEYNILRLGVRVHKNNVLRKSCLERNHIRNCIISYNSCAQDTTRRSHYFATQL